MNRANSEILDILEAIVVWKGLKVLDKEYVQQAISLAKSPKQGFTDAYITVTPRIHDFEIAAFNRKHFVKPGAGIYSLDSKK